MTKGLNLFLVIIVSFLYFCFTSHSILVFFPKYLLNLYNCYIVATKQPPKYYLSLQPNVNHSFKNSQINKLKVCHDLINLLTVQFYLFYMLQKIFSSLHFHMVILKFFKFLFLTDFFCLPFSLKSLFFVLPICIYFFCYRL